MKPIDVENFIKDNNLVDIGTFLVEIFKRNRKERR